MSAPEGSWTHHHQILAWCEELRLLRWVFRIDSELKPLSEYRGIEFNLTLTRHDLVAMQNRQRQMLNQWDLRGERDLAYPR